MAESLFNTIKYILLLIVSIVWLWSIGAVYYTINWNGLCRLAGIIIFTILSAIILFGSWRGNILCLADLIMLEAIIIYHFIMLTPAEQFSNTVWQTPWGCRPEVTFNGSQVSIRNVRDFIYRSRDNYIVRYTDMDIDLKKAMHVDLAVSHWDDMTSIAHTMLTFTFDDGQHLAVSVETRLPVGVDQGLIPGMYKQYELLPILATENDLFKLRTNFRKEELFLYRTNATPEQTRTILTTILTSIKSQQNSPRFYNSFTHNCTTSLVPLLRHINPEFTNDIRLLFNGYSDELLFELGYLAHREGETFAELKKRRKANLYIHCHPDYSRAIRHNL